MIFSTNKSIYFFIIIFFLSSCVQKGENILKNQKTKDEIMISISKDSLMSTEMLNHILLNEITLQKIFKNKQTMQSLLTKDNLIELMKEDTVVANTMMCEIMEFAVTDSSVCRRMNQIMITKNLFEKMGIDKFSEYPLVAKDKVKINEPEKVSTKKMKTN